MPHLARRNLFENAMHTISIFLSFENPPFDSLHLREILRQPRIKFRISKFEFRNFPTLRLQASVVSHAKS